MKEVNKLKFTQLNKAELEKRQMNVLRGGVCPCVCSADCGCLYYGPQEGPNDSYYGGSSFEDNGDANAYNAADNRGAGYTK
jgi:natural product precursor